jgi:hypothetical protein
MDGRRGNWLKRVLLLVVVAAALAGIGLVGAITWEDASAVQVTFINDSARAALLPDCSTGPVTLEPETTQELPVASDHPSRCPVEYLTDSGSPSSYGCLPMPSRIETQTVVRISNARPASRSSTCSAK